jgi:hypothetical protein
MKLHKYIAVGTACAVLGGGGIATAATTNLLNGHNIKKGSIPTNRLNEQAQKAIHRALTYTQGPRGERDAKGDTGLQGAPGPKGDAGPAGADGKDGAVGPKGDAGPAGADGKDGASGFNGAFYSVQNYPDGAGSGGVATAACDPTDATNSQKYAAISGGVQDTDNNTDMSTLTNVLPIAASFPGRMDWSTNTPKPNRLDGWIVQMANGTGQDKPMKVWALCVPVSNDGGSVPVVSNG